MKEVTKQQLEIIKLVCELPPVANIFFMTATDDQKQRWLQEHNYWQVIALGLNGHFSGEGYEHRLKPIVGEIIPRFLRLDIEKWNSFYDLLSFNWSEIITYLKKDTLLLAYSYNDDCKIVDSTPGLAFTFILEQKSFYSFSECLELSCSFSPQQFRRDYLFWKRHKNNSAYTNAELESKNRLDNKLRTTSWRDRFKEGAYIQQFLIEILSKSRNKDTKRNLKDYLKVAAESELSHIDCLRSSNKPQAYKWDNGILRIGTKGGFT